MKSRSILSVRNVVLSAATFAVLAARAEPAVPQNVLQLSAQAAVEAQQDLLTLTLGTNRDGSEAGAVQSQLKTAIDAALAEARKVAQPGRLDVRTGNFSLVPRYGKTGRIDGWQGGAEIVIEGRDFTRITELAGRITSLSVRNVAFGLSREQRAQAERDAQGQAVAGFQAKASELAKGFGFAGYALREVAVNMSDGIPQPRFRMAPMMAEAAASPLPVEAGKATVTVTVSGSVQLR